MNAEVKIASAFQFAIVTTKDKIEASHGQGIVI